MKQFNEVRLMKIILIQVKLTKHWPIKGITTDSLLMDLKFYLYLKINAFTNSFSSKFNLILPVTDVQLPAK